MNSPAIAGTRLTRRQFLKGVAIFGGAIAAGPLLASCGQSGAAGGATDNATDGVKLTIGIKDNPAGFDPYLRGSTGQSYQRTLYSYLLQYDLDLKPYGDAAESWTIADDHQTITIKLRAGQTFHSGGPVSSKDIVAGFERAKDPESSASVGDSLDAIESCVAKNDLEIEFAFAYPVPDGLMLDALNWFPVIEAAGNDPEKLKSTPAGAGPYRMKEFVSGERLVIEAFPGYWDSDLPLASEVVYQVFDSQDTMVSALQSGSLDGATVIPARLANDLSEFDVVESYPGAQVDVFLMNPQIAPWDNQLMRQAMARAIDRDRIVKEVRFGFSKPVVLPYAPSGPASDPAYLQEYRFDLEAARALWESAGSPAGGEAAVPQNPETLAILQVIQSDLKKIGFDLQIKQMDTTAYVKQLRAGTLPSVVMPVGNSLTTPSSISASYSLAMHDNPLWGGDAPAEYIAAIEACNQALDAESQKVAWAELNRVYMDLCWAPGVGLRQNVFPMRKGTAGFAIYPSDDFDLRNITRS